jgi:hypothetical protein
MPTSTIQLQIARATAEEKLGKEIRSFLQLCHNGGEKKLGRNPWAGDLLPYFEAYAISVFDAYAEEQLPEHENLRNYLIALKRAVHSTASSICRTQGVWRTVVNQCCDALDMNIAKTPFGTYTTRVFMQPRQHQLGAVLQMRLKHWEQRYLKETPLPKQSTGASAPKSYPNRANWLKEQMKVRGWNKYTLNKHRGPHYKTTAKILAGEHVGTNALDSVATGLSNKCAKVSPADIPDD